MGLGGFGFFFFFGGGDFGKTHESLVTTKKNTICRPACKEYSVTLS